MNSAEAMKVALRTETPHHGVKLLLVALAQDVRPDNGIEVWPGYKRLSDRMGGEPRRNVERWKAAAKNAGLISVEPRWREGSRGRTSDLTRLHFLDQSVSGDGMNVGSSTRHPRT